MTKRGLIAYIFRLESLPQSKPQISAIEPNPKGNSFHFRFDNYRGILQGEFTDQINLELLSQRIDQSEIQEDDRIATQTSEIKVEAQGGVQKEGERVQVFEFFLNSLEANIYCSI